MPSLASDRRTFGGSESSAAERIKVSWANHFERYSRVIRPYPAAVQDEASPAFRTQSGVTGTIRGFLGAQPS